MCPLKYVLGWYRPCFIEPSSMRVYNEEEGDKRYFANLRKLSKIDLDDPESYPVFQPNADGTCDCGVSINISLIIHQIRNSPCFMVLYPCGCYLIPKTGLYRTHWLIVLYYFYWVWYVNNSHFNFKHACCAFLQNRGTVATNLPGLFLLEEATLLKARVSSPIKQ